MDQSTPRPSEAKAPVRHRIITVEHGGGYAARCIACEALPDEERRAGWITMGGFESRSSARAAMAEHARMP